MGMFSESRLALHNEKAKQHQHQNNNLDTCFACALIELPLQALFRAQEPVPQNAECPPSPPINIPLLYGKIKVLVKGLGTKQQKQQKEPQRSPYSPYSMNFLRPGNRRSTGDSDSKDSCRSFRSRRTLYSRMVSPTGSACNLQNYPGLDSPAMPETPGGGSSVGYPTTPITPPPTPPLCDHVSPGGVCEKYTDTAMACQRWISGVEATDPAHEQEPELESAPETPHEGQSSPLLLPEERGRPPTGLGNEMSNVVYEEQSSLLANPSSSPPPTQPPAPKKRKERPAPVLTTHNLRRRISWKFEKNCDTASAATTPSNKHTGATFALARVQNVSKGRSTFEGSQEMSCTPEHCGGRGGCWNTAATAFVGSNRDSGTTLAASLHSQSEDRRRGTAVAMFIGSGRDSGATLAASVHSGSEGRPECKQHLEGVYCSLEHCGRYQVGVGNHFELPENKRRVSRIVGGLVAAFTKSISWLRGKGWRQ